MENDFLTILALIWVIYIYLFTETDRQISELLNRLKFSISIGDKGVDMQQLQVKQQLGAQEIIDLEKMIEEGHPRKKKINNFHKEYREINQGKTFLIWNLFLLSFGIIILTLLGVPHCLAVGFQVYITLSLVFAFIFYFRVSQLSNLKLTDFVKSSEKEKTPTSSPS